MNIRPPIRADMPDIANVLDDTDLFPVEMLAEMIAPFFDDPANREKWLVCEKGGTGVVGFCYFRPEPLAHGTWNLLAIAVRKDHQGQGYGAKLVAEVERALAKERVLIVETSGLDDFEATRAFYRNCGYDKEAVIRDYWAEGDDKVIYRKSLS